MIRYLLITLASCLIFFSCRKKELTSECITEPLEDTVCITLFDPVCGCDGKTYGNECMAKIAGIKNFTEGSCEE